MTTAEQPEPQTRFLSDSEIIALSALVISEAAEVNAANSDRASRGTAMAYDGFPDSSGAGLALENELKRRRVI